MLTLADLARRCGYHVLVEASPTCVEITGDGRWHIFERECYRLVKHSLRDHVTVILRDPLGGRELRDLGEHGERRAILPSTRCKWKRESHLLGVKPNGRKWIAQVDAGAKGKRAYKYLGTFDDAISAAMARDKYVVEHGVDVALNFPHIKELMTQVSG